MFEFLSEAIQNIINFFSTVWNFIIQFFTEVVYLIKLLGSVIINMPSYFVWLPATITVLIILAISIIVVLRVLGRD